MGGITGWLSALLGLSTYEAPPSDLPSLGDEQVEHIREAFGGNLYPPPQTRFRWYLKDVETAQAQADQGYMLLPAQLCAAALTDGVYAGMLSTRTTGLVRLPKRFFGDPTQCQALEGRHGARSVFDDMCPPTELGLLVGDWITLGIGVAELCPVEGRDFPVLRRLEPQHLTYRWAEDRWYYSTIAGLIPITPGDGRWVLFTNGRVTPWRNSLWRAIGTAWIDKSHARLHQQNWEKTLANPARVATPAPGATEAQRIGFFQRLMAWGLNTVIEMPAGYQASILESNGRGWESFVETIERAEREWMIALSGQTVTTDGGTGFANADIHKAIRADLIDATADALAYLLNTQVIPAWVLSHYGIDALRNCAVVAWDTKPPKDLKMDAEATKSLGDAIASANAALAPYGLRVDAREICTQQGVPVERIDGAPVQSQDLPRIGPAPDRTQEAA